MTSMINVTQLLQAAEFLERREKEHGYASTLPHNHHENIKRKMKSKRNHNSSRSTHNELEKNRRAHLRTCLEKLKEIVPLQSESSRHTTLGLLTNAKAFIQDLEEEDKFLITAKEQLKRKQYHLMKRIGKFSDSDCTIIRKPRQDSTGSCLSSSSSDSEKDDIDVIGYNSDSDDQMSGSDGGLSVTTTELRIVQHLS